LKRCDQIGIRKRAMLTSIAETLTKRKVKLYRRSGHNRKEKSQSFGMRGERSKGRKEIRKEKKRSKVEMGGEREGLIKKELKSK